MSSAYSPWGRRFLQRYCPFLFKKCHGENYHWRWDRECHCRVNEYTADWNGGVYYFSR